MVLGKSHFAYHHKLSPVLSAILACHVGLPNHYNKKDHREIEKTMEDVCCHDSLIHTSTLESRGEIPVRGVEL